MKVRKLVISAILLAICVASMFFKNANVYLTGSIVNACLILTVFFSGIYYSIISSIVTPVFSFIITGSPIIAALPIIMPMIMIGNIILCLFCSKSNTKRNSMIIPMIIGSIVKAIFMGVSISLIIVPILLPEKMYKMIKVVQFTFSFVQLLTALIGSVFATIIYKVIIKIGK